MNVKNLVLLFIIAVLLGACSSTRRLSGPDNLVIYPPPPDTARIQFLTSFSNSVDITGQRTGLMKILVGPKEPVPIFKPYGIAIYGGRIFICDTRVKGLDVVDLNNYTYELFTPGGRGALKKPINCFIDTSGTLYVADVERKQIVIFDKNLRYVASFGDASVIKPTDVFPHKDKIFVADIKNHEVKVYSKTDYSLLYAVPNDRTDPEGALFSPSNIYVRNGRLYVSDMGSANVKEFTVKGKYIRTYGSLGAMLGQQVRPKGIAVDRDGILYVVDAAFENVQMFNAEGKLLMFFGGPYKGPGDMWLPAKVMIDYDNLEYFQHLVDPSFSLKYLIFVTNQFGPDKINVYGFVEEK